MLYSVNWNIDVLCVCDGKLYIGEAKSNNEIVPKQFSIYKDLCKRISPDGIIFATSEKKWNLGTLERIELLKAEFEGQVLVFTYDDLFCFSTAKR